MHVLEWKCHPCHLRLDISKLQTNLNVFILTCGEFEHPTLGGNCYFVMLIDDMSGMIWVCPLKHKADFVDWFFKMDAIFLNQYKRHVGTLWMDNGGEYVNQWLQDYCSWHGILLKLTVPHTPQQNGVTERANWMLTECMHAMMKDTDCPMTLWGEAVCTAAYCLNCMPTSANGGITPFQAFKGIILSGHAWDWEHAMS